MSPEVRDGVTTVAATRQDFEATRAAFVRTWSALLLLPGLVADGWSKVDLEGGRGRSGLHFGGSCVVVVVVVVEL